MTLELGSRTTELRSFDRLRLTRTIVGERRLVTTLDGSSEWAFLLVYVRRGSARLQHAGREEQLAVGDVLVARADAGRRLEISPESDVVVMQMPRESIGPDQSLLLSATGQVISSARGTAQIVCHLLDAIALQGDDYRPENPARLSQHVVGLIALMCVERGAGASGRNGLLRRSKEYIEEHLADIDLTPDRVAESQNVSTRSLHRLFESEGITISGWTRARRLEHCRMELADEAYAGLSVSHIGARWGLWDAANFSRLFKNAFGVSPRAYRVRSFTRGLADQRATA
ncbi:MAG TPA: helix-turn-helix domain-containing protein [Pseudolysinimonas sp.]|jgi:AraC-like DNA-binding protein